MRHHAAARVCHWIALRCYPRAFRREFGDELDRIFVCRLQRSPSRAMAALLAAWLVADAVTSGLLERIYARRQRWAWPRHQAGLPAVRSQTMTLESLGADLRFAVRQIGRAPLMAGLTVASLALGIGANSAMYAVVQSVLLRPLPYEAPDDLVAIWSDNTNNAVADNPVSPGNYEAFKQVPSLANVEAMYSFVTPAQVRLDGEPEPVLVSQVTPGMFTLLGRQPVIGQPFEAQQDGGGAILTHEYWQRRFGGDPGVIGRPLSLSGGGAAEVIPVIGVMPPDFTFPYGSMLGPTGFTRGTAVDMWWAINARRDTRLVDASGQPNRGIHYLAVVGRLRPGASIERVNSELTAIARQRSIDFPDTNTGWGITVRSLHEQTVGQVRTPLWLLMGGVGIVLLITCINVANVLLARAAGRGRDLSIRSALGASRTRLIQQALVESVVLAILGGVAGIAVMHVTARALLAAAPSSLPRITEVSLGGPVLLFALLLALVTGVVVGLLPAVSAARSRAQDTLRDGTRTTASAARRRMRSALIVAEVALAMTLTVSGGLLLRSFVSVLAVDPGFQPEQLLTLQVGVPARYTTPAARLTFYDDLQARLKALPGVVEVGGTTRIPLGSTNVTTMLDVEGRAVAPAEMPEVEMRRAVFDYFAAMRIPLLRGRTFEPGDDADAPVVVVVNEALAQRVFPGEEALGRRVRFGYASASWMTIVGVVGNVKHGSLEEPDRAELYITYRQGPPVNPYLVLRTSGDATALSGAVREVARELGANPPTDVRSMEAIRSRSLAPRRFVLLLAGCFGALALGLAALGVFGVITLVAAERTTEVGIRMALGARPTQVLRLVLGQAVYLALAGVLLGGVVAMMLAPVIEAQLFGVGPRDAATYVLVATALIATALLAAFMPARRAMRVDPVQALRQ